MTKRISSKVRVPDYVKVFSLIERYKLSSQWWEERGEWIAGVLLPREGIGEYKSKRSKMCSIEAIMLLLGELGHENEIWKEWQSESNISESKAEERGAVS